MIPVRTVVVFLPCRCERGYRNPDDFYNHESFNSIDSTLDYSFSDFLLRIGGVSVITADLCSPFDEKESNASIPCFSDSVSCSCSSQLSETCNSVNSCQFENFSPDIALPRGVLQEDSSYLPNIDIGDSYSNYRTSDFNSICSDQPSTEGIQDLLRVTLTQRNRLTCKERRLARMMIVKKKREMGLIAIENSKTVRYQHKQTTAMEKHRLNGKFSRSDIF